MDQKIKIDGQKIKQMSYTDITPFLDITQELQPFALLLGSSEYFEFDAEKYFLTFLESFHKIIKSGSLKLPPGLTLSTEFFPCQVCKCTENFTEQFVRCHHEETCLDHKRKLKNPNHLETCNCRNFNSPCLTHSKIGVVLHLEFRQEDGSLLNLDVDVCPPSLPFSKRKDYFGKEEEDFDGSNTLKRKKLEEERLVDWRKEWDKSEDNSEASGEKDGLKRSIRLRLINFKDVIPEQAMFNYSFLILTQHLAVPLVLQRRETLPGNKKKVYVLLKILKKCTNADITSFKVRIKFF